MRARPLSLLLRPSRPPLALGIVVAAVSITAETLLAYPLRQLAPEISLGVVYLPGILVVSAGWGLALGAATAVLSTAAFDFFHVPPAGSFSPVDSREWAALATFLAVALLLSAVADLARTRAIEADERRGESDLAADMARLLLRTDDLCSALPDASRRLAQALGMSAAAIELESVAGDERRVAFALRNGPTELGTLLVPADVPHGTERRLRERVVPAVEALLRAAREREAMGSALAASRDELRLLAREQAALRRVATLVARAASPTEVFGTVAAEVGRLLGADATTLLRYEADGTTVLDVGGQSDLPVDLPGGGVGMRHAVQDDEVAATVLRTGSVARIETDDLPPGVLATFLREHGIRCSVGAPVVVDGRLWGVMIAAWTQDQPLPAATEKRMAQFTELVATAIANANGRAELAASRARVVSTADETRRRIERDLHDGAQQRLIHTVITLKLARQALGDEDGPGIAYLGEALEQAERATAELRELAHGILPGALNRGLRAGIESLISRVRLSVSVDVTAERLPPRLEATAYFIVAEALTNVVKHAGAGSARIMAVVDSGTLCVEVRDDGVGGARLEGSSGLLGLHDRAAAIGGELRVESPQGAGTIVAARLPIPKS
jgi:signal transduction histidine kinase